MFAIMAVNWDDNEEKPSGMAQALRAALWRIITASFINIFLRSSGLSFMMSIISVLVF